MSEQNLRSSLLGKIAAYTEILAKDPESTIFVSLGEAYRKMGMLAEAKQVIERGMGLHSDFSPAYIIHARILCQLGDYQESENAFEKALMLDNESLAGLVGYARLNLILGRDSKARELLLFARQLSPADPVINKLLLSLPAETEPAVTPIQEEPTESVAPEETTQPPLASATLAELYLKQGLEQQALNIYRQLSIDDPNNLVLRRQIRDLEEKLNETEERSAEPEAEPDEPVVAPENESASADYEEETLTQGMDDVEPREPLSTSDQEESAFFAESQVLETFNRWLNNIQQRRSDV